MDSAGTKKKILFVDDEPNVLEGLKRSLRNLEEWDLQFAESGAVALQKLASGSIDVAVVDLMMPVMDGVQLLTIMTEKFPQTARVILSGVTDKREVSQARTQAHRYIMKPCDADLLISTVRSSMTALALERMKR